MVGYFSKSHGRHNIANYSWYPLLYMELHIHNMYMYVIHFYSSTGLVCTVYTYVGVQVRPELATAGTSKIKLLSLHIEVTCDCYY